MVEMLLVESMKLENLIVTTLSELTVCYAGLQLDKNSANRLALQLSERSFSRIQALLLLQR